MKLSIIFLLLFCNFNAIFLNGMKRNQELQEKAEEISTKKPRFNNTERDLRASHEGTVINIFQPTINFGSITPSDSTLNIETAQIITEDDLTQDIVEDIKKESFDKALNKIKLLEKLDIRVEGQPILHFAVENNAKDIVSYLIENNANPNILANIGNLALKPKGLSLCMSIFGENKANFLAYSPLHLAIACKNVDLANIILNSKNININVQNSGLATALHLAALNLSDNQDSVEFINNLIDKGANVNAKGVIINSKVMNYTPLHLAIIKEKINIFKLLINAKNISLDSTDRQGISPLLLAVDRNNLEFAQLLLKKNANFNLRSNNGDTAIQIARRNGNIAMFNLILFYQNPTPQIPMHATFDSLSLSRLNAIQHTPIYPNPGLLEYQIPPAINLGSFSLTELKTMGLTPIYPNPETVNVSPILKHTEADKVFKREAIEISSEHEADKEIKRKLYKCANCHFECRDKAILKDHKKIHPSQKPFKCTFENCDFSCARKDGLTEHVRIHTKEKPYKCPYEGCDHCAAQKSNIRQHIKRRHLISEVDLKCNITGCSYISKVDKTVLLSHIAKHIINLNKIK